MVNSEDYDAEAKFLEMATGYLSATRPGRRDAPLSVFRSKYFPIALNEKPAIESLPVWHVCVSAQGA